MCSKMRERKESRRGEQKGGEKKGLEVGTKFVMKRDKRNVRKKRRDKVLMG